MSKKGSLQPKDYLAFLVIVIGCSGFILWGLGLSSFGNPSLRWIGACFVALVGFLIAILSRWLS